jgi:hypothetical protein
MFAVSKGPDTRRSTELSLPLQFVFFAYHEPGNPYRKVRLSTLDLLIKIVCFAKR